MSNSTHTKPYRLAVDEGVTDLWWPFGGTEAGRYTVKAGGEESGGRLIQMLASESRGACTPLHVHTDTDETFYVIEGSIVVVVDGEELHAGPGEFVFGPMGVPHAWMVTSERAKVLVTCAGAGTPGPEGFGMHGFFKEVAPEVVDGEAQPQPRIPDPELFASRMRAYGIEMVGPPPFALPV